MNADGANQVNLTNSPAYEGNHAWSPVTTTPTTSSIAAASTSSQVSVRSGGASIPGGISALVSTIAAALGALHQNEIIRLFLFPFLSLGLARK